jgi:hypothetical protein
MRITFYLMMSSAHNFFLTTSYVDLKTSYADNFYLKTIYVHNFFMIYITYTRNILS